MRRYLALLTGLLAALLLSQRLQAATPPAPGTASPTETAASPEGGEAATLHYYNREIAVFRVPLFGVSATDRARRAQRRIQEQLQRPGPAQVSLQTQPFGVLVQIDGATSFVLTPGDADLLAQEPVQAAAERAAQALQQAIRAAREGHDLQALAQATGWTLASAALLTGLLWAGARARRSAQRRLLLLTRRHLSRLRLGGVDLLRRQRAVALVQAALSGVHGLLALLLGYLWLSFVFGQFPYTRPWASALDDYLLALLAQIGAAMAQAVPGLLTALLIVLLARAATRMVDGFFEQVRAGRVALGWLDPDLAVPTRRIAKGVVWLFALAMAYPYLPGAQTEAFKGLSVLVGLMISLGASNLVGQAASGLILTYGRVFRRGEYVRIGDNEGTVTEIGMFATRIRTGMGEELTLSNASILGSTTRNYSRAVQGRGFVLDTTVTIGYDTPWRQVHALLAEAARRTEGVLTEPAPQVFQTALSDWYPQYRLVCQAVPSEPRPRARIISNLHANIQDVFNEYGVQIMSPQYFAEPTDPVLVPRERWFTPPARE
ncbi:MAG: mechanosensitive ion channel family protein [Rhodoferax sp.]|nr:mechanosensitive ion channel family protein [Rhodoferax sp.]